MEIVVDPSSRKQPSLYVFAVFSFDYYVLVGFAPSIFTAIPISTLELALDYTRLVFLAQTSGSRPLFFLAGANFEVPVCRLVSNDEKTPAEIFPDTRPKEAAKFL